MAMAKSEPGGASSASEQSVSPLDLRRLTQFMAVAEHQNLTQAAAQMFLTQQALSSAMRQLERDLGVVLFDRRGRHLALAPAGKALKDGAGPLLAAARALTAETRRVAAGAAEEFVVAHTPAVTSEEVFTLVGPVRAALPQMSITARQMYPDALHQALIDGTIDVGLRRGATTPDDLAAATISYDPLRIAVRTGHPLAERVQIDLGDIADQTLVVWAPPGVSFYTDFLVSACRRAGFEPTLAVNKTQGTPPVTAVVDNDYVAFVTAPRGTALAGQVQVLDLKDPRWYRYRLFGCPTPFLRLAPSCSAGQVETPHPRYRGQIPSGVCTPTAASNWTICRFRSSPACSARKGSCCVFYGSLVSTVR